jgi:hypothetical protein
MVRAEMFAMKERSSAQSLAQIATLLGQEVSRLAQANEKLAEEVYQLRDAIKDAIPKLRHNGGPMRSMADEKDIEMRPDHGNLSELSVSSAQTTLAHQASESAAADARRHRSYALMFMLRVRSCGVETRTALILLITTHALLLCEQLAMSELGEVISSLWGAALLTIGYFGPNKAAFDGVRDLTDASYVQTMIYSLADAGVEAFLFIVLALWLHFKVGVRVLPTLATYVKEAKMAMPLAGVCLAIPTPSLMFFVEHAGVDPTFRFDWQRHKHNSNSSLR